MGQGKEKKPTGRPRHHPEEGRGKMVTVYLTAPLHEKLKRLGGSAWIRKKLIEEDE